MFSSFPRQMAQFGSGDDGRLVLLVVDDISFVTSSWDFGLLGGGVMAALPSGNVGGVGGHSTVDMIKLGVTLAFVGQQTFCESQFFTGRFKSLLEEQLHAFTRAHEETLLFITLQDLSSL